MIACFDVAVLQRLLFPRLVLHETCYYASGHNLHHLLSVDYVPQKSMNDVQTHTTNDYDRFSTSFYMAIIAGVCSVGSGVCELKS